MSLCPFGRMSPSEALSFIFDKEYGLLLDENYDRRERGDVLDNMPKEHREIYNSLISMGFSENGVETTETVKKAYRSMKNYFCWNSKCPEIVDC